jgi:hypothetical protein
MKLINKEQPMPRKKVKKRLRCGLFKGSGEKFMKGFICCDCEA